MVYFLLTLMVYAVHMRFRVGFEEFSENQVKTKQQQNKVETKWKFLKGSCWVPVFNFYFLLVLTVLQWV